jgi:uncharacterized damage-inducible protein DinB
MKTFHRFAAGVLAAALLAGVPGVRAFAQTAPAPAKADSMAPATPGKAKGYRVEFLALLDDVQKKILDLAEAVPADKYAWRPAPGVRSVGEVYMHIAGANYFFPTLWGNKAAAGVDPQGFDKLAGDKAKTIETLKGSFDYLRGAINGASDADLEKPVQFFGRPGTERLIMSVAGNHLHEHLGQSIAYARMNGVVPPWSKGN